MSVAAFEVPLDGIPAHVPAQLVYDFDYRYDPALLVDPHKRLLEIVKTVPPIFYTPRHGGHWVLTSHQAVAGAARMPEIFSNRPPKIGDQEPPRFLPLMADPPEHALYRAPLNKAFGEKPMSAQREGIRELAKDLITKVADKGECDFIAAIGEPLPVLTFLRLLDLPLERMAEFRDIVKKVHGGDDPGHGLVGVVVGIMEPFIIARRDNPRDDLISTLWKSDIGGRPITIEEVRNICMLLYTAGLDTVVNAMGFAARHLAQDPALQARLRKNHLDIPFAVEEMLRRYGIVMTPRHIHQDAEVQGVRFRKGDSVLLVTPAGNLDAAVFAQPQEYNLDRENKSHLTFNAGPHRCVGQLLARFELHILYEELLSGLPEFRLDPDKPARFTGGNVISVLTLPILWDVEARKVAAHAGG